MKFNYSKFSIALFSLALFILLINANPINGGKEHENELKSQIPQVFDYGKYIEKFRKSYGPLETLHKAKLFFGRTLKIFQHNVLYTQKKVTYFLTQNAFTDMLASELRQNHVNKERELAPVKEALSNPDLPADRSPSVRLLKGEPEDGFSQSSLDDLDNNAKIDKKTKEVKPVLNFMDNQNDIDMKMVLRQIKEMPDVANKVAQFIELKANESVIETMNPDDLEVSDILKNGHVEYKPVVASNNNNYEPQVSMSFSSSDEDSKNTGENYAKFLMTDPDFELNLAPYPNLEEQLSQSKGGEKSTMSRFFDSVKGFANYLVTDEWEFEGGEAYGAAKNDNENKVSLVATKQEANNLPEVEVPLARYNIDWRQTGCIAPVQNQKSCDSCYAFATLGLMEYFHCRQTQQLTSFSAQYLVDCGQKVGLNGCRSSKISLVGQFIKKYGIELNAKYPYNAKENTCPYNFEDPEEEMKSGYLRPTISHWQNFQDMAAWYKWLRKSPLIVGINMPADFLAYGGGVHDGLDCISEMTHAMLLVGSGVQNGQEFWLLKNSYSDKWGEEGYFKLSKSAPLRCFNSAIVARAKFSTTTLTSTK